MVLKLMEGRKERDHRFREHVYKTTRKDKGDVDLPTLCDHMGFGHPSATILSLLGMHRLAKLMIFFNTTLPHLNEVIVLQIPNIYY
jgi:hypothetical protein